MKYYKEDVKLGDFIDTQKGYAFKSKWYTDEGTQIVKVSDFTVDSVDTSELVSIPTDIAEKYQKYQLITDDVIVQTVGSWPSNPASVVGKVIKVPSDANNTLLNQNAVKLIPDEEINKRYLFYLLKSPKFKEYIVGTAQGAASQASITLDSLRGFKFNLPHKSTQKKIASILSAFDDLISTNARRIAILEEMARRIYREWFVHFRYPGHENDELVDSGTELGDIPEGWEVQPVDEVIDAMGGGTPRTKVDEYWERGDITWFTPSDLTSSGQLYMSDSGRKITDEGLNNSSAKMFPPYSVMMTSRATLGVIAFNAVPASVNQGFIVCIPNKKVSAYQIYFWLQEKLPNMINQASGATYKEIRKTDFRKMNFPVIEKNLHKEFVAKVEPLFKQIENLEKKNDKLKETRDLLLPKLISGTIEVGEV